MKFLVKLISSTAAILAVCYLLPGVRLDDPWFALLLALVFAFLNVFIKPILIVLTLPITITDVGFISVGDQRLDRSVCRLSAALVSC